MPDSMHRFDRPEDSAIADAVFRFARKRVEADATPEGLPIGTPRSPAELDREAGRTITAAGIGAEEAMRLWTHLLEPSCLSTDHHGYLAFVPQAPSEVAVLADLMVSASSVYAGSWLEGSGAVWAENQALRWICDLAGMPESAGGVFVQGGTNGNLSAMVAAREAARHAAGEDAPQGRWVVVCGEGAHASVSEMATVMDCDVAKVEGDRLSEENLRPVVEQHRGRVACVVATAGTTNLGRIDRLNEVADVCDELDVWMHVDGAYGLAGLLAPSVRDRFAGIERADSFIVDPHKWLYTPFDCCALIYRNPARGRAAHTQKASYLELLNEAGEHGAWNPSDYAVQLSRRARGVPLWFALAVHGTDEFAKAIERNLATAHTAAQMIEAADHLTLLERPELSIVAFTRDGWGADWYARWSTWLREAGIAFVVPSKHRGEPILRMAFINPRTTVAHIEEILESLA